jgi:rhodanese-related sulfurtransferase
MRARGRTMTVERLLAVARAGSERLTPAAAHAAMGEGAALVDIRSDSQRARDGTIPGARYISRNVLEWRLDPACAHRDPVLACRDARLVLLCDEGYQSSLAAATVRSFGVAATDVIGGFQAWRAAGLPVERGG